MTNSDKLIESLSPRKRALFELLLEEKKKAKTALPVDAILCRPKSAHAVLSFAQQRLWFLDKLEPESTVFNIPVAYRVEGLLSVGALEQTLDEVIRRHEVLRTRFEEVRGEAHQVIEEKKAERMSIIDLSGLVGREQERVAERLGGEEASRRFDLREGPMVRARLVRMSEEEQVVLFTMHHIVSDGWSMGVFIREVGAVYERYREGLESRLEELEIQYGDYAVWQREWMKGEVLEEHLGYWRKQLGGIKRLEIGRGRVRGGGEGRYEGGRERVRVSEEVSEGLRRVSREEGVTLFMSLLGAFQVLLHRYTGVEDITIGTDVANRDRIQTEGLLGFFVNQLALRTSLSGDPTFRELLRRSREVALEAYAHQNVPFEKLVEVLQPQRERARSPLFQVKLVLQYAAEPLKLTGLTTTPYDLETGLSRFDLVFLVTETEPVIAGSLDYNADLFDEATIAEFRSHLENLLESIIADPDRPLSSLRLLSDTETEGVSPSSFTDVDLSQEEFERLVMELNKTSSA